MALTAEHQFIRHILRATAGEKTAAEIPRELNWPLLLLIADRHNLFSLFWDRLQHLRHQLPASIAAVLENNYVNALYRQLHAGQETERLLASLERAGIGPVLLKGVRWAEELYPAPGLRTFSDIDILVRKKDYGQTRDTLLSMGYRGEKREQNRPPGGCFFHHHYYPPGGGLTLELHWGLTHPCRDGLDMGRLWRRVRPLSFGGWPALALSPADDALHMAVHIGSHGAAARLPWFLDFALLLKKYGETIEPGQLWEEAQLAGCRKALSLCCLIAASFFSNPLLKSLLENKTGRGEKLLSEHLWEKGALLAAPRWVWLCKLALMDRPETALSFALCRAWARLLHCRQGGGKGNRQPPLWI